MSYLQISFGAGSLGSSYLLISLVHLTNELLKLRPDLIKKVKPEALLCPSFIAIAPYPYPEVQLLVIYQGSNKILNETNINRDSGNLFTYIFKKFLRGRIFNP